MPPPPHSWCQTGGWNSSRPFNTMPRDRRRADACDALCLLCLPRSYTQNVLKYVELADGKIAAKEDASTQLAEG